MAERVWSVEEHRGPEGLAALEADWRRLYLSMPNPAMWHSHEANSAYLEHLCPAPASFRCLALSDGETVRSILPVEERIERGFGLPLRVWGMPWRPGWVISDAIGPEDDARRALLPAVVDHMRRQPGRPAILVLGRTWGGSIMWDGLDTISAATRFAFSDGAEFVIPTDMSAEEFMDRLSGKSRSTLRKSARGFEALPGAEYVRVVAREDLEAEYPLFLEVEASGWKGERGSAINHHPDRMAFYRSLIERMKLDGWCEIHVLRAEGRSIASEFCLYTRRECAALKGGYDESYARLSPGRLITHKTVEWSCADPDLDAVSEISAAPWLHLWRPNANALCRAYVSLRPVSGGLLVAALRLRYGLARRLVRGFKVWWRAAAPVPKTRRGRDAG